MRLNNSPNRDPFTSMWGRTSTRVQMQHYVFPRTKSGAFESSNIPRPRVTLPLMHKLGRPYAGMLNYTLKVGKDVGRRFRMSCRLLAYLFPRNWGRYRPCINGVPGSVPSSHRNYFSFAAGDKRLHDPSVARESTRFVTGWRLMRDDQTRMPLCPGGLPPCQVGRMDVAYVRTPWVHRVCRSFISSPAPAGWWRRTVCGRRHVAQHLRLTETLNKGEQT